MRNLETLDTTADCVVIVAVALIGHWVLMAFGVTGPGWWLATVMGVLGGLASTLPRPSQLLARRRA